MSEVKKCIRCGKEKPITAFGGYKTGPYRKNVCMACYSIRYTAKAKYEFIVSFGGKCQCCGESHPTFLTLEHVGGRGDDKMVSTQAYSKARREGYPKDKYQLLCMNCNFAAGHFGKCPHQLGITPEQELSRLAGFSKPFEESYSLSGNQFTHGYKVVSKDGGWKVRQAKQELEALGLSSDDLKSLFGLAVHIVNNNAKSST